MKTSILNLCGGKILPEIDSQIKPYFLLNLDQIYLGEANVGDVRLNHFKFLKEKWDGQQSQTYYCNYDVYQFLERYDLPFDLISIYRFLEHVPKSNVLYFIYLLSTCTTKGSMLDIIVPDCKKVAQRIIDEDPFKPGFESEDIITTYEMVNDMPSPHLSIWTKDRLKYFFELEGRFRIVTISENYKFDGRDIYLRSLIERV